MSHGKVEQVGTPNQIYNFPSTEFVAKFVGQLNMLPVEVIDSTQGTVKLGTQIVKAGQFGHINGRPVRLAVRPEELNPGRAEGANHLIGRVDAITYLGSIIRISVDVEGHLISLDMFNERRLELPVQGDSFEVNFPVDACWLL